MIAKETSQPKTMQSSGNPTAVPSPLRLTQIIAVDGPGGGPKTVYNYISYFAKSFDVQLLHGGSGYLAEACDDLQIPRKQIPLDEFWLAPFGALVAWAQLLVQKPDVLILHGQWGAFWGAIAGRMAGVRSILYIAQWPSFYTDWDLGRIIRNYLTEWVPCRLSSAVVAISPGNRNEFLRRFPFLGQRLHMIPNSIDRLTTLSQSERAQIRSKEGWDNQYCEVVCVGRLSTQKRVDWLLKAWKIVETHNLQTRLWIVGDGEEEASLKQLSSQLELKTCTFLGARPAAWKLIAAADIVAMPTMYEGHANIPLEAMACGTPIVACAVDGVRESFKHGDAGFLVPPADPPAFAAALLRLIESPELRLRMGHSGSLQVENFDKKWILQKFYDMVRSLTPANTPSRDP
jgi:glycosyltransferase involved in cell wall biosynthesis